MKKLFIFFYVLIASAGTMFAASGTCGSNLTWDLTNGVLTISGTGNMTNWSSSSNVPWYSYRASITEVSIGNSVTSIGDWAFQGCSDLTSVTIPNSVTRIGNYAFYGCRGLTSVTIGNSVEYIGDRAFYLVPNIVYSGSATGSPWGARCINGYVEGYLVYSDDTKTTLLGCSSVATGEIVIPNSVTSIGSSAFSECSGLTSVTIGNSVTSIGGYAFSGCSGLTSVTIPNSVTSIGNGAFYDCTGLTSITIPNSVTSIGEEAFERCSRLTSITIPNSVTSIGEEAFNYCSGLTSITAPAIIFNSVPENYLPYYASHLDSVVINGDELTENGFMWIGRSYKTLHSLDLSAVTNTELEDEAFKGFYNLRTLRLPANLSRISYMAVAECKNLQTIDIPASVEEIDQSAFEDCRSLRTITFGGVQPSSAPGRFNAPMASASQLRKIGNWAFYNAHELQNLEIPEGVEEIGDGAFYGCVYMEELQLPSSVQSIGDNCFALCSKLNKIVVNAVTPPTIWNKTFYDVKRQIPVYVPDDCVNSYESDALWNEFDIRGISSSPSGIETINDQSPITNKVIVNGQILILRGDRTYTITGQEVK